MKAIWLGTTHGVPLSHLSLASQNRISTDQNARSQRFDNLLLFGVALKIITLTILLLVTGCGGLTKMEVWQPEFVEEEDGVIRTYAAHVDTPPDTTWLGSLIPPKYQSAHEQLEIQANKYSNKYCEGRGWTEIKREINRMQHWDKPGRSTTYGYLWFKCSTEES